MSPQSNYSRYPFFPVCLESLCGKALLLSLGIALFSNFPSAFSAVVSSDANSGTGSLRATLPIAAEDEEVTFSVDTVNLTSGNILVNNNNVSIDGLTNSGSKVQLTWFGSSPLTGPLITQRTGISGLNLKNIAFSNFSQDAIELTGGGLVSAQSTDTTDAFLGSMSDVVFTDNTVAITVNAIGGGLVGAGSYRGNVAIGDISGEFINNTVSASTINGGGLVGAGTTSGASSNATLGSIDAIFTNNQIRTSSSFWGGGLVGASVWSGDGSAEVGPIRGAFTANEVTSERLLGGGLIGTQSQNGIAQIGDLDPSTVFSDNRVTARQLLGGGLVASYSQSQAVLGQVAGTYTGNSVSATSGLAGGGLTGVYSFGQAAIGAVNTVMTGNTVSEGLQLAGGGLIGAFSDRGNATIGDINGVFGQTGDGNTIQANSGLYGGGIVGAITRTTGLSSIGSVSGSISGNSVTAAQNLCGGGLTGAFSLSGNTSLGTHSGIIADNRVNVGRNVLGGGLGGAWSESGTASFGGLLNALVTRNTVTIGTGTATGIAVTGGLFGFSGLDSTMTLADSAIIGNTVTVSGANYSTDGGLIYIGTNRSSANPAGHEVSLVASAGNTMEISGNSFLVDGEDRTKSLVFGTQRGLSLADAALTVNPAAGGEIILAHPVYVAMDNGKQFSMTIDGPGRFFWDGRNELTAEGGAQTTFLQGSNSTLGEHFSLASSSAGNMTVNIEKDASIALDATRDSNSAVFDFTNAANAGTAGSFSVGTSPSPAQAGEGAIISVDTSRALSSFDKYFLVADGIHSDDRDSVAFIAGENVIGLDASRDGQYWIYAAYDSPHETIIECWKNLKAGAPSLEELLADRNLVSDAEAAAVLSNLHSATPDQVINQARAGMNTALFVATSALNKAFPVARPPWYDIHGDASRSTYTVRPWVSYIHQSFGQGSHDRYRGFDQNINGVLFGINFDFARLSAGMYAGYTDSSADTRGAHSEVDSDGYHVGIVAKALPIPASDAFAVSLDAGYSHINNDSMRDAGAGDIEAEFNQDIYTAGLAVEYAFSLEDFSVTPIAKVRYAFLDQGSAREKHGLTSAKIDDLDGYSFSSEAGLAVSRFISFSEASGLEPYVNAFWRHEYGDRDFSTRARYIRPDGETLPDYRLRSVEADKDSLVLGTGLQFAQKLADGKKLELNLGYDATIGKHGESHSIIGGVTLSF